MFILSNHKCHKNIGFRCLEIVRVEPTSRSHKVFFKRLFGSEREGVVLRPTKVVDTLLDEDKLTLIDVNRNRWK